MMGLIEQLMKQIPKEDLKSGGKYRDYSDVQNKARGMKAGGTASARADGCAIKGKTKGKMI
jgi:hypothetical protein